MFTFSQRHTQKQRILERKSGARSQHTTRLWYEYGRNKQTLRLASRVVVAEVGVVFVIVPGTKKRAVSSVCGGYVVAGVFVHVGIWLCLCGCIDIVLAKPVGPSSRPAFLSLTVRCIFSVPSSVYFGR